MSATTSTAGGRAAERAPWTEEFRPASLNDVAGNNTAAEQLLNWVKGRLAGLTPKKAAMLHGPPGTGKTLSVSIVARMLDAELIEMNASDFRTEELVQKVAGGAAMQASLFGKKAKIIFLDELDGISGREDRGGVGAIAEVIRSAKYPIVVAMNDPWDPKFRSLRDICEMIKFSRIRTPSVAAQLKRVAKAKGVLFTEGAIGMVAERAGGDLRAAINDFQMVAAGKRSIAEDDVGMLYERTQEKGIFDIMKGIFSADSVLEAKLAIEGSAVDIEMVFQWINENIAVQYPSPTERAEAYDWLSKGDFFMSNARRKMMWALMSYGIELAAGGAALARSGEYRFARYSFPRRIGAMSRTKDERGARKEMLLSIGRDAHVSMKKAMLEYMPYIEIIMQSGGFGGASAGRTAALVPEEAATGKAKGAGREGAVASASAGIGAARKDKAEAKAPKKVGARRGRRPKRSGAAAPPAEGKSDILSWLDDSKAP